MVKYFLLSITGLNMIWFCSLSNIAYNLW